MTQDEKIIDPRKTESFYQGEDKLAPCPLSVSSPQIKAIDKRLLKGTALETMQRNAEQQIVMLKKQADLIMKQAKAIEDRLEISYRIYQADFSFEPVIGNIYHLYSKEGQEILSMISPVEWGEKMPFEAWVASVRLLGDRTWDVLSDNQSAKD